MKKVLVLDDQKEMLEIWHHNFRLWNIEVELHTGMNGLDGLAKLKAEKKFDLIITDYRMPGMDGLEFIETFRKSDTKTPVCFFTGYLPELAMFAEKMENVLFFEKPLISQKMKLYILVCLENNLRPTKSV